MLVLLSVALQSSAPAPPGYDTQAVTRACNTATDDGTIVVCGSRKNDKYRLKPLAPPEAGLGRAETTIAGAKVGVGAEQGSIGGIPTNRLMAHIKIKF
jgi:hypothetical protein